MRIKNGLVFGSDEKMHQQDLCFTDGVITEQSADGEYDASGCYVLPGLIDTHLHGVYGCYFATAENLSPALDWLEQHGVTGILPTVSTRKRKDFLNAMERIGAMEDDRILGIHAEGPFLNPVRSGGMMTEEIAAPDVEYLKEMIKACQRRLKLITLAPEMEGAEKLIKVCNELGIAVSMGHTDATYEEAKCAVDRGVTRMTHTYNAMGPLHHREPGVLGLAFDETRVNCELICDFVHVSAPMVRLALKAKGYQNITMISDSEIGCGLENGEYTLGDGRKIVVENGVCMKKGTDTITGGAMCLAEGARNLFRMGIPPEQIAVIASTNPARVCGCDDRGRLTPGCRADIVIFDKDFRVKAVFAKGKKVK